MEICTPIFCFSFFLPSFCSERETDRQWKKGKGNKKPKEYFLYVEYPYLPHSTL